MEIQRIYEATATPERGRCQPERVILPEMAGRTIRGFINKLFEDVGLPPIYIKANERTEYHLAMNKANNEGNYDYIKGFYRYKVCDSIIELDINNRIKKQDNEKKKIKELKINS